MQDQQSQPLQQSNSNLNQNLPPPIHIDIESLYMLFDEMTEQQLKELIEDIEQEIDIRKYEKRRVDLARDQVAKEKYRFKQQLMEEEEKLAKQKQKFLEDFEREKERVRMGLVKQQSSKQQLKGTLTPEETESEYSDLSSESLTDEDEDVVGDHTETEEDEVVEETPEPAPKPKSKPKPVAKAKAKAKPKAKEEVVEEPKKRPPIKRNKKKSN